MALGINQIAGISGQFAGLLLGGLLAQWDWRAVFWVSVPVGLAGTFWSYRSLREIATTHRARIDWAGNLTFTVGAGPLLIAITYGIQPYGGHPTGWTNPWVLGGLAGGAALLVLFGVIETRVAAPMFRMGLFRIRASAARAARAAVRAGSHAHRTAVLPGPDSGGVPPRAGDRLYRRVRDGADRGAGLIPRGGTFYYAEPDQPGPDSAIAVATQYRRLPGPR